MIWCQVLKLSHLTEDQGRVRQILGACWPAGRWHAMLIIQWRTMSKKEAQHRSLASVHKHTFLLPHTYINSHKRSHIRTKQNIIDMLVEMTFQSKHFRLGILFPPYECWMLFFFSFLDENRFSWRRQLGKIQVPPSTYCRPGGWRGWEVCVSFLTSHSLTSGWKSVEQHQLLLTAFGSWRECRIFKTQNTQQICEWEKLVASILPTCYSWFLYSLHPFPNTSPNVTYKFMPPWLWACFPSSSLHSEYLSNW